MDECRRLAREGEKATRLGDTVKGIELLEKALAVGIDDLSDLPLLSAIYSQLGNAYYAKKFYDKALTYHGNDLMLSRVQKDLLQQAKAYANLSATYTMLYDFSQAITCADNVICLGKKLGEKELECRGLYNLGLAHLQNSIHGNLKLPDEVNAHLQEAVKSFEKHLEIAKECKDDILCGLAIGNLGNAYFYLGNYEKSIAYHLKRLDVARSVGDKSSMRRSFTNMANAYALLGNHDEAAKCYKFALDLASEAGRKNLEAQLLFSLGTVDSLRKNYNQAVPYYIKHLHLARQLNDNAGESRANTSLAAALVQLNDYPKALYFLIINYKLAKKLGDESMKKSTLEEIKQLIRRNPGSILNGDQICLDASFDPNNLSINDITFDTIGGAASIASAKNNLEVPLSDGVSFLNTSASSMPNLSLSLESFILECARSSSSSTPKKVARITLNDVDSLQPISKYNQQDTSFTDVGLSRVPLYKSMPDIECNEDEDESYDDFMDRIAKVQGNRIDDQRASPKIFKDRTNNEILRHSDNLSARSISGGGRKTTFANIKSMGNTLRRNVVKPFYNGDLHQKQHKSSSGLLLSTTNLKSEDNRISLGGRSSDSYSDASFSKKSFYESFPAMFGGIYSSRSVSKSVKKSKKVKKLLKTRSEKILSQNLTQSGKTKNNINNENFCDNNEQRIDEETENDLNVEKVSSNGNSFSIANESPNEESKNNSATETPVFRVPDILVKQRFDRLKSSRSVSTMCPFTAAKSLANSTSSLGATENIFKTSHCTDKFLLLPQHQSFNNNYEYNPETILDLIESIQGRRMDEQRANLVLPGINNPKQLLEKFNFGVRRHSESGTTTNDDEKIDERLYELIVQSQADRLEDQRSELGGRSTARVSNTSSINEDIVSDLVQKMQIGRIEEQRAMLGNNNQGGTPNRSGVLSEKNSDGNALIINIIREQSVHENNDGNKSTSPIVSA